MAQSHEPPTLEKHAELQPLLSWRWDLGVSGCPRESQSYTLSTVIVGTIYDASSGDCIDRRLALLMSEAKTWRRSQRRFRSGEG